MNKSSITKWFKPNFDVETSDDNFKTPRNVTKKNKSNKNVVGIQKLHERRTSNVNLIDKVAPVDVSDLAVNNKKLAEVENWFITNVMSSDKVSVLLVTGPTGSGKTATIQVLCKSMNIEIAEWVNPQDVDIEEIRGPGQTAKFTEFLMQSSRYPSLIDTSLSSKKIILVEDFPNSIVHNPSEFEGILQKFLDKGKSSAVLICTDSKNYHSNLAQQLFPQSLRDSVEITTINFIPASATLLKAALKRTANIIQEKYTDIYQIPNHGTIESIINSSMGDIRCALNSFNFACLKGSKELQTIVKESQSLTGAKRKRKDKETLSNMCKDQAIGLLHGVGRVLYPKRIQNRNDWKFEHEPETIVNEFITQPTTFVNFLHENYLRYFGNFKDVVQAADILSSSELLLNDWKDNDIIAQYGLCIAIMGLMVVNEHSEAKWNPVKGPRYIKHKHEEISFHTRQLKTIEKSYYEIITKFNENIQSTNLSYF